MIDKSNPHLLEQYTQKTPCVIFFHMDGCGHCEGVKKVWPNFKRNMCQKHKTKIPFIDVNANALPFLNNKYNIRGFPTIGKSMPAHSKIEEFAGPDRSKKSLINWFESKFNRELKPRRLSVMTLKQNENPKKKVSLKKKAPPKKKKAPPKKKKAPPKKKKASPKKKKALPKKKTVKRSNISEEDSIYESPRSSLFS